MTDNLSKTGLQTLGILHNVPFAQMTTFRIGGPAKYVVHIGRNEELLEALAFARQNGLPTLVLGGGSNVVAADRGFRGLVLKMQTKGITVLASEGDEVRIRVAAGEVWDDLVRLAVESGWWGVENLSYIPGTVGALAVNNVGAYGQEASHVIEAVEAWDRVRGSKVALSPFECRFSYRSSIFNSTQKGRYVILSVVLRLRKNGVPVFRPDVAKIMRSNRDWHSIKTAGIFGRCMRYLGRSPACTEPRIRPTNLRTAVISLRTDGRLPDLKLLGNAGSFFKAAVLTEGQLRDLLSRLTKHCPGEVKRLIRHNRTKPDVNGQIRISVAPIIRAFGLVGSRFGGAAIYDRSPLVVVNANGRATARDIMMLAKRVRTTVFERSGLLIPIEPELVGFSDDDLAYYLNVGA